MAGFLGQAEYSIDGKGRVALPAKMRRALSPEANETFVATRGLNQCVFLYPLDLWTRVEAELAALNRFKQENLVLIRTITSWSEEVQLDGQGRIALSKRLMDFAGLGDKATILGALDHIEIWAPDVFDAYLNQQPEQYETIAERVLGGVS